MFCIHKNTQKCTNTINEGAVQKAQMDIRQTVSFIKRLSLRLSLLSIIFKEYEQKYVQNNNLARVQSQKQQWDLTE